MAPVAQTISASARLGHDSESARQKHGRDTVADSVADHCADYALQMQEPAMDHHLSIPSPIAG